MIYNINSYDTEVDQFAHKLLSECDDKDPGIVVNALSDVLAIVIACYLPLERHREFIEIIMDNVSREAEMRDAQIKARENPLN